MKDAKTYLSAALNSAGLVPIGKIGRDTAFGRGLDLASDLRPIFLPSVVTIKRIPVLAGVLGLAHQMIDDATGTACLNGQLRLSCHSTNFSTLQPLNRWGEEWAADVRWCCNLRRILDELPRNEQQVARMIREDGSVAGVGIREMLPISPHS